MAPGTGSGQNPKVRHSGAGFLEKPAPPLLYGIDMRRHHRRTLRTA